MPELVNWNESVHCTPNDKAFKKCDSTKSRAAFYDQPFMLYGINCAVLG